ncbi:MAG: hypothetical protein WCT20_03615 [Candidatus Babeliales bacterium]|jgi:hypothetical protein
MKRINCALIAFTLVLAQIQAQPHQRNPFQAPSKHIQQHRLAKSPCPPETKVTLLGITRSNNPPARYGALVKIDGAVESVSEGDSVGPFHVTTITNTSLTLQHDGKQRILTFNTD